MARCTGSGAYQGSSWRQAACVPVGEAEQIAAALREKGRPVELLVFDDEGHGIAKQPNRIVYFERLVKFFGEHLRG